MRSSRTGKLRYDEKASEYLGTEQGNRIRSIHTGKSAFCNSREDEHVALRTFYTENDRSHAFVGVKFHVIGVVLRIEIFPHNGDTNFQPLYKAFPLSKAVGWYNPEHNRQGRRRNNLRH